MMPTRDWLKLGLAVAGATILVLVVIFPLGDYLSQPLGERLDGQADGSEHPRYLSEGLDPAWQPLRTPIIFIPGFLGSKIACGTRELWPGIGPDLQGELLDMRLADDGVSNQTEGSCNSLAAPTGELVGYDEAVEFLKELAPNDHYLYAYDWRKSPQRALFGLDRLVERARCGGSLPPGETTCSSPVFNKVVLMAHSMGGLVARWYIDDPAKAAKINRALTIGTPYWGSAKAVFPLAAGIAFNELDPTLDNDDVKLFARNLQGLYFLYPSTPYGPWLQVGPPRAPPLDRPSLLDYVSSELAGNRTLIERALDDHAGYLDTFRTNGVDYQVLVGRGFNTIERVRLIPRGTTPGFTVPGDYVVVGYANGDATVPVRSAVANAASGSVPVHYACRVRHQPLPGDPAVTERIRDFLVSGEAIEQETSSPASCPASGFEIAIFEIELGPARASESGATRSPSGAVSVRSAQAGAAAMTLEEAAQAGLIDLVDLGRQRIVVTDGRTPVELKLSGSRFEFRTTPLSDGVRGAESSYGPLGGEVEIAAGETLAITQDRKPLTPRPDDPSPQPHLQPQVPPQAQSSPQPAATGRPGKCSKLRGKRRTACVRKRCSRLKCKRKKACVKKVTRRR